MRYSIVFIFLFFSIGFNINCSKEYPFVDFISPNDKETEYFLDRDTFQVISYGFAFDTLGMKEKYSEKIYFPLEMSSKFNIADIIQYNAELAKIKYQNQKLKKIKNSITLQFLIDEKAKEKDILTQDIKKETIENKYKRKKAKQMLNHLEHLACRQAKILALYRWNVLAEKDHKNYEIITNKENTIHTILYDFLKTRYYKSDETNIILKNFSKQLFPPKRNYENKYLHQKKYFKNIFNEVDIQFELIQESFDNLNQLRCKAIIHIKQKNLVLNYKHLVKNNRLQ